MSDIHFYVGYVKTNIDEPFVFEVEELEIEKVLEGGTIKLKHPYFYSSSDSTYYFGGRSGRNTDVELNLRSGSALYSTDIHKCRDFVLSKMYEMYKMSERMASAKLEVKFLENNL